MPVINKIIHFARKPLRDKRAAISATFRVTLHSEQRRLHRLLNSLHAPPAVLQTDQRIYVAYRPDSDVVFKRYPELARLSEKWINNNFANNAGDLPRFYALVLNIKQVLDENVSGDMAELGVYRGNSAALLSHYAQMYGRKVHLFDTFEGFDKRDMVGVDESKAIEFSDTSIDRVRDLVGGSHVRFVQGRFPESIPSDLYATRFCVVHIDCDLYEPAKAGLEFFYPRMSPGGLLIMHDYTNPYWGGIKRALDEYCRSIPEKPIVFGDKSGTAMIRRSTITTHT